MQKKFLYIIAAVVIAVVTMIIIGFSMSSTSTSKKPAPININANKIEKNSDNKTLTVDDSKFNPCPMNLIPVNLKLGAYICRQLEPNHCRLKEYMCTNGNCILETKVCDNRNDCGDGSDENNCTKIVEIVGASCDENETKITHRDLCDGHMKCPSSETFKGDEDDSICFRNGNFGSIYKECNGVHVAQQELCNGRSKCANGDDENKHCVFINDYYDAIAGSWCSADKLGRSAFYYKNKCYSFDNATGILSRITNSPDNKMIRIERTGTAEHYQKFYIFIQNDLTSCGGYICDGICYPDEDCHMISSCAKCKNQQ